MKATLADPAIRRPRRECGAKAAPAPAPDTNNEAMAINLSLSKLPWYAPGRRLRRDRRSPARAHSGTSTPCRRRPTSTRGGRKLQAIRAESRVASGPPASCRSSGSAWRRSKGSWPTCRGNCRKSRTWPICCAACREWRRESNLTIRGFTPQAVAKKQLHMEWPIGLKLEGRYHDLGAFLERVSKFPRIINVGDIKIKAVESRPAARRSPPNAPRRRS